MKTNRKQFKKSVWDLSITVVFAIMLFLASQSVFAGSSWREGEYAFDFCSTGVVITAYNGSEQVPVLPSKTRNGYTVSEIGKNVFNGKSD